MRIDLIQGCRRQAAVVELVTELKAKGSLVQGISPDNKVKIVKY
jgi:alpha-D-ribose 1-methylphosphonate 5-triphosphate synthase subunit PhnL